jgi:CRISPR-associated protein Cst2
MANYLASLSISARATLDLHSLNNEGGEGNQIQTRMVNVVDADGLLHNVNAISGDMYKHIAAEHLYHLAREADSGLPLCAGCQTFNANRINADKDFIASTKKLSDSATIDELLRRCVIDDVHGILITEGGRSLPRKSVLEFGWVTGIPEQVRTDSYFHVKYVNEGRAKSSDSRESEAASGSNLGQSIFHRPASSGVYATIAHVDLARIGYNDIAQAYAIDEEERLRRANALLQSLLYTFLEPRGAMRSAQAPHLVNLQGVLTLGYSSIPAPSVSPLNPEYADELKNISAVLNSITPNSIEAVTFGSLGEFSQVLGQLINDSAPYALPAFR